MNNKSVKIIVSAILIIVSYGFIIHRLIKFDELKEVNTVIIFHPEKLPLLLTTILLMFLNWSIETLKWKMLVWKVPVSFSTALKTVISSITVGIFTPNRIGEIGGRAMLLGKGNRTYGILATSLGSFAQFSTTIFNGLAGLALFLLFFPNRANINPIFNKISVLLVFFIFLLLLFIYFNSKQLKPVLLRFSFFRTRIAQLGHFSDTGCRLLFQVLMLSIFRYAIFITQFYLLLRFFDIHLPILHAYVAISLIYLFATLIPTTTLLEFGIRGSLAIFFLGLFSENNLGIVLATMFLWIINLGIPSVIGSVFLIRKIVEKRIKYVHLHK